MKRYLLNRLRERSTWQGLVAFLTACGWALQPDQVEAIVAAGLAGVAALQAFLPDPKTPGGVYDDGVLLTYGGDADAGAIEGAQGLRSPKPATPAVGDEAGGVYRGSAPLPPPKRMGSGGRKPSISSLAALAAPLLLLACMSSTAFGPAATPDARAYRAMGQLAYGQVLARGYVTWPAARPEVVELLAGIEGAAFATVSGYAEGLRLGEGDAFVAIAAALAGSGQVIEELLDAELAELEGVAGDVDAGRAAALSARLAAAGLAARQVRLQVRGRLQAAAAGQADIEAAAWDLLLGRIERAHTAIQAAAVTPASG